MFHVMYLIVRSFSIFLDLARPARFFLQRLCRLLKSSSHSSPLYVFYAWKHRVLSFMFFCRWKVRNQGLACIGWRYMAMLACANSGLDCLFVTLWYSDAVKHAVFGVSVRLAWGWMHWSQKIWSQISWAIWRLYNDQFWLMIGGLNKSSPIF